MVKQQVTRKMCRKDNDKNFLLSNLLLRSKGYLLSPPVCTVHFNLLLLFILIIILIIFNSFLVFLFCCNIGDTTKENKKEKRKRTQKALLMKKIED